MQRILTVTYGYLKFTFNSMLASAILFALAGLSMTSPRAFLVVIILAVPIFLLVRGELQIKRKHVEARKRKDDPDEFTQESIAQWIAFAQATSLIVSSMNEPEPTDTVSMVVTEWIHKYDPSTIPVNESSDKTVSEETQMSSVLRDLERHREDLKRAGFSPAFLSRKRASEIMTSIHERRSLHRKTTVIHVVPDVPGNPNIVSIGFIQRNKVTRKPENEIAQILQDSFDFVNGVTIYPPEPPLGPNIS
jgi:hypothetical protein